MNVLQVKKKSVCCVASLQSKGDECVCVRARMRVSLQKRRGCKEISQLLSFLTRNLGRPCALRPHVLMVISPVLLTHDPSHIHSEIMSSSCVTTTRKSFQNTHRPSAKAEPSETYANVSQIFLVELFHSNPVDGSLELKKRNYMPISVSSSMAFCIAC